MSRFYSLLRKNEPPGPNYSSLCCVSTLNPRQDPHWYDHRRMHAIILCTLASAMSIHCYTLPKNSMKGYHAA
ncbi:uncharacterized protein BDV17DRAFT_254389 [Aspergillus undulatus]|uniref:uncharacterized protein n=1 Tax=Aspergillus undulatus TaxID=1810928 RepID=UPI003CCD8CB8